MLVQRLLALCLASACLSAAAQIPDSYRPMVIEPPLSLSARVIDLTPAVDRARREGKPLYLYLGARDCPPCKAYTGFLQANREALQPAFDQVVVADVRTWLRGPALVFKIGEQHYTAAEFKALVGDVNQGLSYPSYWLLTPQLRQVRQFPKGGGLETVAQQLEALRLPDAH